MKKRYVKDMEKERIKHLRKTNKRTLTYKDLLNVFLFNQALNKPSKIKEYGL